MITDNNDSTVYYYTLKKLNSYAYITKTYHDGKPLPIGSFVLKRHFAHIHFAHKLKPIQIGPYKFLDRLSEVTYELLAQDGSTLHVQRNHLIPYYPKGPLLYPHIRPFMRFSDSINYYINIPEPIKYANSESSLFNSNEPLSDDTFSPDVQNSSPDNLFQNSSKTNPSSELPHLSKKFSKLLMIIIILTEPVTHLKTNQLLLVLLIVEIPKLIII